MAEEPVMTTLRAALWRQYGAAIDMLEKVLAACPLPLWRVRLWPVPSSSPFPSQFGELWYVVFHALVWCDLYLSGLPEGDFAPPAPFAPGEIDSVEVLPEQPYTKEVLHTYLVSLREKCHRQYLALLEEQAQRSVTYPWSGGQSVSFLELQLYNLRHLQEHAAQLSLFLGQHTDAGANFDVARGTYD